MLLEIILLHQEGESPELVKQYFSNRVCARGKTIDLLVGLQDAGIVLKSYKIPERGTSFNPNDIPINKNVIKDFFRSSFDMGKELFEVYPLSTVVNGVEYKLRRISKKFDSLEDAYRAYGRAIRNKPEIHKQVIELVREGINNNYNFTNLGDFIVDHDWVNMQAMKKDSILTESNLTLL